jgi:hypothetical protein
VGVSRCGEWRPRSGLLPTVCEAATTFGAGYVSVILLALSFPPSPYIPRALRNLRRATSTPKLSLRLGNFCMPTHNVKAYGL